MLLIERILAAFTIWLCDLMDLTQTDIERYRQQERAPVPATAIRQNVTAGRPVQTIVRFGR